MAPGMSRSVEQVVCCTEHSAKETESQTLLPSLRNCIHPEERVTFSDSLKDVIWAAGQSVNEAKSLNMLHTELKCFLLT